MPLILITGVSTGIGRACAERFAREGWKVIGTTRDPARYADVDWPGDVVLEPLELGEPDAARELGERVIGREGCPDVLLNNAGTLQFGPLETIGPDELERLYRINVFSQLELVQSLLPCMRERGSGTIANVTSLGGRIVFPFFAGYNSTKWALEGVTEGLWHELKPFGILVKAIEPGYVDTAIWGKVLPGEDEPIEGPEPYLPYMRSMRSFEGSITRRTSPEDAAGEVYEAVTDTSDRLRYPVAAYARPIVRARGTLGDQRMMRIFHPRWMERPTEE
jgi:NAD(P)-dependent dehydrogenase (short-subunit alcohol dehydrogenase family)